MSDPSTTRKEVDEMRHYAKVCCAVDGGTEDMREKGNVYLPKWKAEEDEDWKARLACSTLFPAFSKTLDTMIGKPFGEPIVLQGPESILAHCENIDLNGRDLDTFAKDVFRDALKTGISWILVDYPTMPPAPNLASERATGARPYWVHIDLEKIIGWKTENIAGKVTLTQLRYWECVEVEDGPWGVKEEKRVKVLYQDRFEVWKKRDTDGTWVMLEEGPVSLGEIPLVAVYTGRESFFEAEPPLSDLAWLNVAHWQSSSDQRNILHKARVPFLAADEDARQDQSAEVTFKAGIFTGFKNLHPVSFDSAPIEAGRQDLLDLEDQMRRVAGELLSRQAGDKSATEAGLEASEGGAWLKGKVRTYADALEECFRLHCAWLKERTPVSVTLNTEWDNATMTAQVLQQLTTARQAGLISAETYLNNLHEAGYIPEGRTVADELAAIEAEGPRAMSVPAPA